MDGLISRTDEASLWGARDYPNDAKRSVKGMPITHCNLGRCRMHTWGQRGDVRRIEQYGVGPIPSPETGAWDSRCSPDTLNALSFSLFPTLFATLHAGALVFAPRAPHRGDERLLLQDSQSWLSGGGRHWRDPFDLDMQCHEGTLHFVACPSLPDAVVTRHAGLYRCARIVRRIIGLQISQ